MFQEHPWIDKEIRDPIRRISRENPTWGVPRIQAELHLLGYETAASTVAKHRGRPDSLTTFAYLEGFSSASCRPDCGNWFLHRAGRPRYSSAWQQLSAGSNENLQCSVRARAGRRNV